MTVAAALLAAAFGPAPAASRLVLDPAASSVGFRLRATAHSVEGSFAVSAGELQLDPGARRLTGRIVVDARSGRTGNERRDRKMHEEVLESGSFPEIVFEPESYTGEWDGTGAGRIQVRGHLSLHGVRHALELPVQLTREGTSLRATASFVVPYVEWGLVDPSVFVLRVAKSVDVTVELVARAE